MLEKEFGVKGTAQLSEAKEQTKEGNKKAGEITTPNGIVVNLFQKDTVLDIKKCTDNCKTVSDDEQVCKDYPGLKGGMHEFLNLEEMNTPQEFSEAVSQSRSSVYDRRQEKGHAYDPLVDFFNGMSEMSQRKDVQDNFGEFKLLVKYPALTPYMYEAETVDENTLEDFFVIAYNEYDFYDLDEFLSEYFLQVYDNFNIDISKIQEIIKKAGERNKFFSKLNKIIGFRTKLRTSGKVNTIHWLLYWPIALLFMLFELVYTVTKVAKKSMARNFFTILAVEAIVFPLFFHQNTLLTLFWPPSMVNIFESQMGGSVKINVFTLVPLVVIDYAAQGFNYVLPALFFSLLLYDGGRGFYKMFDWVGIERTFKNIFKLLSFKTEEEYSKIKEGVVAKYVPGVIANLISLGIVLYWVFS